MAIQQRKSPTGKTAVRATKKNLSEAGKARNVSLLKDSPSVLPIRQAWGVNRKVFSRLSGYAERTIAGWESGKGSLNDSSRQRMLEMQRLQKALADVMDPDFIPIWLQTPNDAFSGLKPLEIVERGEIDRIWRMVFVLESGMPR